MRAARQWWAMARLSWSRAMGSRLFWGPVLLFGLPLLLVASHSVFVAAHSGFAFTDPLPRIQDNATAESTRDLVSRIVVLGGHLQFAVIFSAIFFGFTALREESENQTLHYLYLQPIPRWAIVLGKYAGFMAAAGPVVVVAVVLAHIAVLAPYGARGAAAELVHPGRVWLAAREILVLLLALAVWSAFFLLVGTLLKNLFVVLFIYGWETGMHFLPGALKQFSLSFYLQELLPGRGAQQRSGLIELVAEAPGPLQTTLVLAGVLVGGLAITCLLLRWRECSYGSG